jgi:hypothetical protein
LLRPPFSADEFTATKWDTADAKAQFANKLGKFIAADFKEGLFTNAIYSRLSNCFGHIAHYSRNGFFETFFQTLPGKIDFLEQTLQWPCFGDTTHTFCDVERAVQARLHKFGLLDAYQVLRAAEMEKTERATLTRLKEKFEGADAPARAETVILTTAAPCPARRTTSSDQQSLF